MRAADFLFTLLFLSPNEVVSVGPNFCLFSPPEAIRNNLHPLVFLGNPQIQPCFHVCFIFFFLLPSNMTRLVSWQEIASLSNPNGQLIKNLKAGAPGRLTRWSVRLRLRSWSHGSWVRGHVRLCADSSEPGAHFGFCASLSLSAPPLLMLSVSLCHSLSQK